MPLGSRHFAHSATAGRALPWRADEGRRGPLSGAARLRERPSAGSRGPLRAHRVLRRRPAAGRLRPMPGAHVSGRAHADALGECLAHACPIGLTRDASGRCLSHPLCADGRLTNAAGFCEPLILCSNGYAPIGGRCARGATLGVTPKPQIVARPPSPVPAPRLGTTATPTFHRPGSSPAVPRPTPARPELLTPRLNAHVPTPRAMAPRFAFPSTRPSGMATPHFASPSARPAAVATPRFTPPVVSAPHLAPATPPH